MKQCTLFALIAPVMRGKGTKQRTSSRSRLQQRIQRRSIYPTSHSALSGPASRSAPVSHWYSVSLHSTVSHRSSVSFRSTVLYWSSVSLRSTISLHSNVSHRSCVSLHSNVSHQSGVLLHYVSLHSVTCSPNK